MINMNDWNDKRLSDFFRQNFNPKTCTANIKNDVLTVLDSQGESLTFEIRQNRIYCAETGKYYS